jgi:hypothetical protein
MDKFQILESFISTPINIYIMKKLKVFIELF